MGFHLVELILTTCVQVQEVAPKTMHTTKLVGLVRFMLVIHLLSWITTRRNGGCIF